MASPPLIKKVPFVRMHALQQKGRLNRVTTQIPIIITNNRSLSIYQYFARYRVQPLV